MGSLDTESDPKILEQKHETESNKGEPQIDTPTTSDKNDLLELTSASDIEDNDKKVFPLASPSSSISSTISIVEDSLQDSDIKNGEKVNEGVDHTSETPPIQVMERPTTPKNRIPSSVFARKHSASQDWAMASNESLFSIQMSFNYQDSINWKSGDLERHLQEAGSISETGKTHGLGEEDKIYSLGDTSKIHGSSIADESIKPNSQENQGRKFVGDARISQCSAESESAKSFTFPILTGETEKGGCLEVISESEQPEIESEKQPHPKPDAPPPTWTNCFGLAIAATGGAKKEEKNENIEIETEGSGVLDLSIIMMK